MLPVLGKVIVVDNSALPEPAAAVVARHPMAQLVRSGTNLGYGAGANLGVREGDSEYVLVMNSDTRLHAGAVEALIDDLDRHPEAGIRRPRLGGHRARTQHS